MKILDLKRYQGGPGVLGFSFNVAPTMIHLLGGCIVWCGGGVVQCLLFQQPPVCLCVCFFLAVFWVGAFMDLHVLLNWCSLHRTGHMLAYTVWG